MKDEYNGRFIAEFVGLRPKMYSILEADGHEKRRRKVSTNALATKR